MRATQKDYTFGKLLLLHPIQRCLNPARKFKVVFKCYRMDHMKKNCPKTEAICMHRKRHLESFAKTKEMTGSSRVESRSRFRLVIGITKEDTIHEVSKYKKEQVTRPRALRRCSKRHLLVS